jgi:hypothetical protein
VGGDRATGGVRRLFGLIDYPTRRILHRFPRCRRHAKPLRRQQRIRPHEHRAPLALGDVAEGQPVALALDAYSVDRIVASPEGAAGGRFVFPVNVSVAVHPAVRA